ncbi:SEC-C metal-binding domain-containing protein [soil metagenome]
MDPKMVDFLFGGPPDFDADDPEARELYFAPAEVDDSDRIMGGIFRSVIANQIAGNDPPEAWNTALRLLALGLDRENVMRQLVLALGHHLVATLGPDGRPFDRQTYLKALEELPLPTLIEVQEAYLQLARSHQPIRVHDLELQVADRFGRPLKDLVMEALVYEVSESLFEEGVVEYLIDDLVVHPASLTAGAVFTHEFQQTEIESGLLNATVDLAPFIFREELTTASGSTIETLGHPGSWHWSLPEESTGRLSEGQVVAVTVDEQGVVEVTQISDQPAHDRELVERVRRTYNAEIAEDDMPVMIRDLIHTLLTEDGSTFGSPRPPLHELCRAAGLEVRGSMVAHDAQIWENLRLLQRTSRILTAFDHDSERSRSAEEVLELAEISEPNPIALKRALRTLADPEMAEFVVDELTLMDPEEDLAQAQEFAGALIRAAGNGLPKAVAHWVAAVVAERAEEPLVADAHLHEALTSSQDWEPVLERAAWYASDRGDAQAALSLLRRLPNASEHAIATLIDYEHPPQPNLGRNEPCWCGSGRKFKQCHWNSLGSFPLPERVRWLCFKAVQYLEHQEHEAFPEVMELAQAKAEDPEDVESLKESMGDPLVIDLALTELGWFDEFVAQRGSLLPEDELLLAQSWALVERTVYQIEQVRPGEGLTIRDLASGDLLQVRERAFSAQAKVGWMVCARAVPDGQSSQFIGGMFIVGPGSEGQVLDLCADGDAYELAEWAAAAARPPTMVTREGEPIVACTALWRVRDPERTRKVLSLQYEVQGDGWTETYDLGENDSILRAHIQLEGADVTVTAMSDDRMDRVLGFLRTNVEGTLLSDERTPVGPAFKTGDLSGPPPPMMKMEGMEDVVAQMQQQMEDRWMIEPVPALSGLTPVQAAADPTRREQLGRLLDSFDEMPDLPEGGFSFRVDRLRRELGMER